jgi:hypothetical protein
MQSIKTYHDRIPWHCGKKLIEQISETQFINQPVITITINDSFVKVENNNNVRHFFFER